MRGSRGTDGPGRTTSRPERRATLAGWQSGSRRPWVLAVEEALSGPRSRSSSFRSFPPFILDDTNLSNLIDIKAVPGNARAIALRHGPDDSAHCGQIICRAGKRVEACLTEIKEQELMMAYQKAR